MTLLRATQTVLALYDGICFQAETKISIVGTSFETPANLRVQGNLNMIDPSG